jgi:hypothetical protein
MKIGTIVLNQWSRPALGPFVSGRRGRAGSMVELERALSTR